MTRTDPPSDDAQASSPDKASNSLATDSIATIANGESMRHNVSSCPICGGGLCGVRAYFDASSHLTHGLIVCDECEAIWLQPKTDGVHVYADPESPQCPVTGQGLYDRSTSRWANQDDVRALGWTDAMDPELTFDPFGDGDGHGESSNEPLDRGNSDANR